MSDYDWQLSAGAPLCLLSDSFYYTARDSVFRQLRSDMTKEQWQAALESLTRHRDELVQDIRPMHYGSLVGGHRCVEHLFREAQARLRFLEIMQPVPQPPPPESDVPPTLTREVVVDVFGAEFPPQTLFGEEQDEGGKE